MIVTLPAELTIAQVAEQRAPLLAALRSGEEVRLDARAVTRADVAGLQLLVSACKSALASRVPFGFVPGSRSEALDRAAAAAGLLVACGSAEESLWTEADRR